MSSPENPTPESHSLRRRLYELMESHPAEPGLLHVAINSLLIGLILLNVAAVILESVEEYKAGFQGAFYLLELVSVVIFTIEYIARVWAHGETRTRLKYCFSIYGLVDLIAIVPFYLGAYLGLDMRFLRILRLFRLLKIARFFSAMAILGEVFRAEGRAFCSAMLILVVLTLVSASLMYLIEGHAQPDQFGSIPSAIWWTVVTLTTVGYGDVVPVTAAGRVLGVFVMVMGIGMVALPAGMLASRFSEEIHKRRNDLDRILRRLHRAGKTPEEVREELEGLRVDMGLSEDDLERAMDRSRKPSHCPHCGGLLDHRHH